MHITRKLKYFIYCTIGLLCLLTTASCSNKMAYNYLDWAIMWQVNKYIDLNTPQKKVTKNAIDDFHAWHKKTQLPKYAHFFKRAKPILLNNPTAPQLHAFTDDMQIFIDDSLIKLIPTIISITQSLDDKQVNQILKKVDKDNKKYKKKYIDISEKKLLKARQKQLDKYLKKLIGDLTDEQKSWLKEWAVDLADYEGLMLQQQYQFRRDYEGILHTRKDITKTTAGIKSLMLYKSDDWTPDLREKIDINQTQSFALLERIFKNLTHKQKQKMEKTLDKYIDMFDDLAKTRK